MSFRRINDRNNEKPNTTFEMTSAGVLSSDVTVIGGGVGGVVAAIASSRAGARTVLIEEDGFLGGSLTRMGVSPMMTFHAGDIQVIRGIAQEIIANLVKECWSPGHIPDPVGFCATVTPFDPEGLKLTLDSMCADAGVIVLFHSRFIGCEMDGDRIRSVEIHTKGGIICVASRIFVDSSGDADVSNDAGVQTILGRVSDHASQPMTMNVKVYGVDTNELNEFQRNNPSEMYIDDSHRLGISKRAGISGAYSIVREAIASGELSYNREAVLAFEGNTPGEYTINMSRIAGLNPVDPYDLSEAERIGRRQSHETVAFLRAHIPGFENCKIAYTGPTIGVRESRKIVGEYTLTSHDLIKNVMFDDAICMGGYPIDLHDPSGRANTHYVSLKSGSWYSIPYRSLLPVGVSNLVVTGRCLSATQDALAAVRVSPIVMGFSQAAGLAAAMASRQDCSPRDIDICKLREMLISDGVFLDKWEK